MPVAWSGVNSVSSYVLLWMSDQLDPEMPTSPVICQPLEKNLEPFPMMVSLLLRDVEIEG